ncbi:isocitrate lyase/PEP mutase family protein [Bosea sp. (in: a-proteobacteria)]|uniref:isocitrate lyase/PEP mutase family protein n=1 Tax=Bosea sp. (in: a-proteobacteria) TaxID=1871050 RepID=UPI002613B7CF|nr:isocitrate lyase/PEP mutase family protein [Bosea sp. (in: a-proteobacteria)]MCO5089825.1 isocitrate lyase/PEP mutase family protein [Bosea sp. (in: a-proteobacteria)]
MTNSSGSRATPEGRRSLRSLLAEPGIIVAPGVADGLMARLVAEAGFQAVYATGGAINRSRGLPDLGLTSLEGLCSRVTDIAEASGLPVIVDADSGFGGILNIGRTVRALERAGACALHLQDSQSPRLAGPDRDNLLGIEAMRRRIAAALAARRDPGLLIIARTDASDCLGLTGAIERARAYAEAGADLVYVEHLRSRAEIEDVARQVRHPMLISLNKGLGDLPSAAELAALGYKLLTHPADMQLAAIHAMRALLAHLAAAGSTEGFEPMLPFAERDRIVGQDRARAAERTYFI